jgi:hypothetical protein
LAKLNTSKAITGEDIKSFVDRSNDFSFEMQVLNTMSKMKFDCSHSGSYCDFVSKKIRQFDIRASRRNGDRAVYLAIEAKNLGAHNPLLIYGVPREQKEATFDIMCRTSEAQYGAFPSTKHRSAQADSNCWISTIPESYSIYRTAINEDKSHLTGKSMDQIGNYGGEIKGADQEVFEKCSQAISSITYVISREYKTIKESYDQSSPTYLAFVPIVVIPDNTLWVAEFDALGNKIGVPYKTRHIPFYVDHKVELSPYLGAEYSVTHLEVVEVGYLPSLMRRYLSEGQNDSPLFYGFGTNSHTDWF